MLVDLGGQIGVESLEAGNKVLDVVHVLRLVVEREQGTGIGEALEDLEAAPKSDVDAADAPVVERAATPSALNSLFAPPPPPQRPMAPPSNVGDQRVPESIWPRALADAFSGPRQGDGAASQQNLQQAGSPTGRPAPTVADIQKLRSEIARLDLLVKKLQTEMQIERQYTQALELQIQTLTRVE